MIAAWRMTSLHSSIARKVEAEAVCLFSHGQWRSRWRLLVWTRFTRAYEVVQQVAFHVSAALVVYSTAKKRSWSVDKGEKPACGRQFRSNYYEFIHSLREYMVHMTVVYH